MKIALVGTRGVPARYGGFETAVEEVGRRLVDAGHEIVVFCRGGDRSVTHHQGMQLVHLPSVPHRALETLSHTTASVLHQLGRPADAAVVFNAANAPLVPVLRARGVPTAVHVDGLEWQRGKWGPVGRRYYRWAERVAVRVADALIADARGIQDHYRLQHGTDTWFIPYGAPDRAGCGTSRLADLGLRPRGYHLVVARVEPENNVLMVLEGYRASRAALPLVVVGSAPTETPHLREVRAAAALDDRVHLVGSVWDQDLLDQLYAGCLTYLHGHSVGGTNPSLLRAAGAAAPVVAVDVVFTREVLAGEGVFFAAPEDLRREVEAAEDDVSAAVERGMRLRESVLARYDWDDVARDYERLAAALVEGTARQPVTAPTGLTPAPAVLGPEDLA